MNEKIYPKIGQEFPEIEIQSTQGIIKLPNKFKRKWFVLFSYPADFTPISATQFIDFSKKYKEFEKLNCELIGLATDHIYSHLKWIEWLEQNFKIRVQFPIVTANLKIIKKLGLIQSKKLVRAVFIIDQKGTLRLIQYYPLEIGIFTDELLRVLKALQTADNERVLIPVNWPNNEIIGQQVLIPPAVDSDTASKNMNEYSCFDWWFCYKSLEFE
jgi:peroxiredoxin (alkyl hydroperoxide reductase subunit C)